MGASRTQATSGRERTSHVERPIGIIFLVYLIIGVVVAWSRGYLHLSLLKAILSAVLAILLWWLPLLGVSLHLQ